MYQIQKKTFVLILYILLLYNCDPIAEVNAKIQEAEDTYIRQATFLMKELMEIVTSEYLQIRIPDKPGMDTVSYNMNKLTNRSFFLRLKRRSRYIEKSWRKRTLVGL